MVEVIWLTDANINKKCIHYTLRVGIFKLFSHCIIHYFNTIIL